MREVEIRPGSTFKEFQDIILSCSGIKGNELSSFFICNSNWGKQKEITLIDMGIEEANTEMDEEDINSKKSIPVSIMEETALKDAIDDPHQRLIFEYDFLNPQVFYIELVKILDTDPKKTYPLCSKSQGVLLSNIKQPNINNIIGDEDAELLDDYDDGNMLDEDDLEEGFENIAGDDAEW